MLAGGRETSITFVLYMKVFVLWSMVFNMDNAFHQPVSLHHLWETVKQMCNIFHGSSLRNTLFECVLLRGPAISKWVPITCMVQRFQYTAEMQHKLKSKTKWEFYEKLKRTHFSRALCWIYFIENFKVICKYTEETYIYTLFYPRGGPGA